MLSRIRWDDATAQSNRMRHDRRFEEAATIFFDPHHTTVEARTQPAEESRFAAVGASVEGAILVVLYVIRSNEVHILGARPATRMERRHYMSRDESADEPATEYDFSRGVRGRHFIKPEGPIHVTIDPVVAEYFPDEQAVNDALRVLIVEGRATRRE